jgi:hypothetical protein
MTHVLRSVAVALLAAVSLLAAPGVASAAPTAVGYDVSYPQCDSVLPASRAFVVIGVNGGLSTRTNPCLTEQLEWAWGSAGAVGAQPKVQLYLNSANPGQVPEQVSTWPIQGATPYGTCDGSNSMACSWQYGKERALNSFVSFFTPAARAARIDSQPARYTWWLDVETMNTWQAGSPQALARNRASLEGMTAYLLSRGARVGLYSTRQQWTEIVGTVPSGSNLTGLDSWLAGATTSTGAKAACSSTPLVAGGRVILGQYVDAELDRDYSCR